MSDYFPQMILTLKMVGLSFEAHDTRERRRKAGKQPEEVTEEERHARLTFLFPTVRKSVKFLTFLFSGC